MHSRVNRTVAFAAALVLAVACGRANDVTPGPEGGGAAVPGVPMVTVDEEGRLHLSDPMYYCSLTLPGSYWECKSPGQLAAETQTGGCAPAGGGMPQGMAFILRHKDAPAAVTLRVLPQRFLMRGKDDLESFVEAQESQLKERGGGAVEFKEQTYGETDGVVWRRSLFTATGRGPTQTYLLVHFFVRPAGQDARMYQLAAMTLEETYEGRPSVREDIESVAASFRYTGELAPAFFAPDAPAEKLPTLDEPANAPGVCGGGFSGLLLAGAVVFLIYTYMRRRSSRSQMG